MKTVKPRREASSVPKRQQLDPERTNTSDSFSEDSESDDGSSASSDVPKLVPRENREGEYHSDDSDDSDSVDESSAYLLRI